MTREEAIEIIRDYDVNGCGYCHQGGDEVEEAFDMAIKALSAESCEDCISRAELLKAIDTWDKFGVDDTNSLFRLDNLSLPHYVPYIHYDDVVKAIKGMPSVQPKPKTGHWVHGEYCSECGCDVPAYISDWKWQKDMEAKYCPNCGAKMLPTDLQFGGQDTLMSAT